MQYFFSKRQSSFWIFQNTIAHLAVACPSGRNLAPFDTPAILARSFWSRFTERTPARGHRGPPTPAALGRWTHIYLPVVAFGSVPTASDIYVTHCPARGNCQQYAASFYHRLQCRWCFVIFTIFHINTADFIRCVSLYLALIVSSDFSGQFGFIFTCGEY